MKIKKRFTTAIIWRWNSACICLRALFSASVQRELGDQRRKCGRGTSTHNHRHTHMHTHTWYSELVSGGCCRFLSSWTCRTGRVLVSGRKGARLQFTSLCDSFGSCAPVYVSLSWSSGLPHSGRNCVTDRSDSIARYWLWLGRRRLASFFPF